MKCSLSKLSWSLALAVPFVLASPRQPPPPPAAPLAPPPRAHATDVWLGHADGVGVDVGFVRRGEQHRLAPAVTFAQRNAAAPGAGPWGPFQLVGSVAVLEGDATTTTTDGTGFGIEHAHLATIATRFIQTFGDNYDQLAVFLTFSDRSSRQALAYQMPVKNDVTGIGIGTFDDSARFGSPSGRLQTVLNMKRITIYGRDAAADEDNDLYYVWAQEAAHRWLVYFRFQRRGEMAPNASLLGRMDAHWARTVQADASIMDGYLWKDNGDGTFTPVERGKRYGTLDQYGMGLRKAEEVPPFFLLENLTRETGEAVNMGPISIGGRYKATRVDLTIDDVIRAIGRRNPAEDKAAQDLRMGVVLLTAPGVTSAQVIGESFRIDTSRRIWTDFYNAAGGGRGVVCSELLRPCRGAAFAFDTRATITEAAPTMTKDGVVAPGETFVLALSIQNVGSTRATARIEASAQGGVSFARAAETTALAPGQSGPASLEGKLPLGLPCGEPVFIRLRTQEDARTRLDPSQTIITLIPGLVPAAVHTLDDAAGGEGWRVDPAGTDTAAQGRWELATPSRTSAFEFVMQPGAAQSGTRAFVTGAAAGQDASDHDVDGVTTLESPPFSLAGLGEPHLMYQVYFVAADFDREVLLPGSDDSLRVLGSVDEGASWTEIDRVTGMATGWQQRAVRLSAKFAPEALAGSLRLRFVAEDAGVADNVVEAVIDDIGVHGEAPSCGQTAPPEPEIPMTKDGGCDCALGGPRHPGPGMAILLGAAALLVRRRRRASQA